MLANPTPGLKSRHTICCQREILVFSALRLSKSRNRVASVRSSFPPVGWSIRFRGRYKTIQEKSSEYFACLLKLRFQRTTVVPNVSFNRSTQQAADGPAILGIWRLGKSLCEGIETALSLAQPAEAPDSPRWDYAIKRALPSRIEGRMQIAQFVASASEIVHPNVVPVLDASVTGSTPYLVMPRIEGRSMRAQMTTGSTPLPVALWLVRQIAQALDATHTSGWVHGDVKPDNVIVGIRGHVTLIDFGFAARIHAVPNHVYRGTPDYSAPEALRGQTAMMPAMDIFSLGRVLWQWLTRTEPVSETLIEPIAGLVEQMICSDPTGRPTAGEVARQLLRSEIEMLGRHIGPHQTRRAA